MPVLPATESAPIDLHLAPGCRLWIDGVGCWLLWCAETLTLGNAAARGADEYRVRIVSDLHSQHGRWDRCEENYSYQPLATSRLNGRLLESETGLQSGDELQLGASVVCRFAQPSPLSPSAVLTITSGHRTVDFLDGILLFRETCLLGPDASHHIRCRHWELPVILFEQRGILHWRHQHPDTVPAPVCWGTVFGGEDSRMRCEPLGTQRKN